MAVAHTLGLEVDRLEIRRAEDIAPAFEQLKSGVQALYVCTDALANANRHRINILALGARLPTMLGLREYVDPAGLMSYGPHIPDLFCRTAGHVDKILRAKLGDAGRAADQVRADHESHGRQGARPQAVGGVSPAHR
jgi:ABC-type uncharacterized transport system substrate-binding protein